MNFNKRRSYLGSLESWIKIKFSTLDTISLIYLDSIIVIVSIAPLKG